MTVSDWQKEKKKVLETSRRMLEKGLVVGTAGNVSLRLPTKDNRQLIAVTPSSKRYDSLSIDDIQIIDFRMETIEGNLAPSMESKLHISIYRAREDVNAVIHTHSLYASAVAVTGRDIPPILEDQVAFLGGEIITAAHALTGSEQQVKNVLAALADRNAVLLENHGAIGTGISPEDAFTACELIEKTAGVYLLALSAGKVNLLPPEAIEAGKALYYKHIGKQQQA